jgi:DNA modification methylase
VPRIEKTTLHHGDCLEIMKTIPDKSVDLVLCDLPYGTTDCKWDTIIPFDQLWKEYRRILKNGGVVLLFNTEPFGSSLRMSNINWYKYDWVWHKSKCGSGFTSKFRPQQKHENISVFASGKTTYNPIMRPGTPYSRTRGTHPVNNHNTGLGKKEIKTENMGVRYPETVIFFQQKWRRQDQTHPTQKPVELLEYLIKTYTNEGETVLDNTMGSGSTGVAAINLNRRFIGIELDSKYFEIAKKRILKD